MRLRESSEIGPIGLDLDEERLHMLQMERAEQGLWIRAAASIACPGDRESGAGSRGSLRKLVAKTLKSQEFHGRRVVTSMPRDQVKLMVLNFELGPGQTEPELILSLVEERIQESLEECVVDYLPIRQNPDKRGEHSALVAIAREDAVIRYLELLRSAGLQVEALEIGPAAVRRLVARLAGDDFRENVLVINFGRDRSYLVALWGRRLTLYREIEFGEAGTIDQLCKTLDMTRESTASLLYEFGVFPDPDREGRLAGVESAPEICRTVVEILKPSFNAVAEQVGNALVYTASRMRGESVHRVYILGTVARWPGADRLLGGLLCIPVEILDPAAGIALNPGRALESMTPLALAAGLALRGIGRRE